MKNSVIVFGGGLGIRFEDLESPKQFKVLHGLPIYVHTLLRLQAIRAVDEIILVLPQASISKAARNLKHLNVQKVTQIVAGGKTSFESRRNGLAALSRHENGSVIFHDAVRPFIESEDIKETFLLLEEHAIVASITPVRSTPLTLGDVGNSNPVLLPPAKTFVASSPQGARLQVAREVFGVRNVPEDHKLDLLSLCVFLDLEVHLRALKGPDFKLTYPSDWQLLALSQEVLPQAAGFHD